MNHLRLSLLLNLALVSCASDPPRPATAPPPCVNGAWGCNREPNPGPYAPNNVAPPAYTNYPPGPASTAAYPIQPAQVASIQQQSVSAQVPANGQANLNPPPFSGYDPIFTGDLQFLTNRSSQVVAELIANLDSTTQGRVRNIPIVYDPNAAEV